MKLHIVPAKTGLQWVKLGVQTFWRQPMALTALLFLSMAAVSIIGIFPIIGPYLALVLMPTVLLGVCYTLGIVAIAALTSLFDDGTLAKISLGNEPMTPELAEQIVQQPGFQIALWTGFALYNILAMLMWHAPALVQWHGVSPIKAIFFSVVACLRNFRAFFMYALGWMGLTIAAGLALSLVTVLLSALLGSAVALAANILTIMLGMGLVTMFLTSAVFTFRDCFSPPDHERTLHVDDVTYDYK